MGKRYEGVRSTRRKCLKNQNYPDLLATWTIDRSPPSVRLLAPPVSVYVH